MRVLLFFIFTFLFSCSPSPSSTNKKPRVLVSIAPYHFFVSRITNGVVEIHTIVPPGADAHSFEPTPRQRKILENSSLWFQIGEPFERSLREITRNKIRLIDLCQGIELLSSHCQCQDRHLWMSPKLAKQQVLRISEVLKKEFPEHEKLFSANTQQLLSELTELDQKISLKLASAQGTTLLVSHPSFSYFCRDYSLDQLSIEQEGKDPRPKHLEFLLHKSAERHPNIKAITLPQYNNKGLLMIAEKLHVSTHQIDPYTEDYFSMMEQLTDLVCQ